MLKRFSKEYPLIVIASVVSAIVIVVYSIFANTIPCQTISTIANILFQLSIGIIINSVFFFTQIYLAQRKQREYADKCIVKRIAMIQSYMKDIFRQLSKLYIEGYQENADISKEELKSIIGQINSEDYVRVINPRLMNQEKKHFKVREWIISRVEYVERDIDRLCTYYVQYLTPELSDILDQILDSTMHNNLCRSMFQSPNGVVFKSMNQDIFFEPYYNLIDKLEQQKKLYE